MVETESRKKLDRVNEILLDLGMGQFRLAVVDVDDIELAPKNARFMANETYKNLVQNIKNDGALTSVPFCWKRSDGKYRVLSGNHRVKAAKDAGLRSILILFTEENLSRDREVAIQLSHNSIVGQDDPVILKELYSEIQDLDLKFYAGLDDKLLKQLDNIVLPAISEEHIATKLASILFLPKEIKEINSLIETVKAKLPGGMLVYLAALDDYERYLDAISKIQSAYDVHNLATAMHLMLLSFERHIDELHDGWLDEADGRLKHKNPVPIASVFGADVIPAHTALSIRRAVDRIVEQRQLRASDRWRVLELWAMGSMDTPPDTPDDPA